MDMKKRKAIVAEYKERPIAGGVFAIRNLEDDKVYIDCAEDLAGSRNRFEFSRQTGSAVTPKLQADWEQLGAGGFAFEVLEELKKTATQTDREYRADLKILKALWVERYEPAKRY